MKILILILFILGGCSNHELKYQKDEKVGVYKLFYPKNECNIVLDLNQERNETVAVYSNCLEHRSIEQTVIDINNLINHFKLEKYLKKLHLIKMTFLQGTTPFPNFVRYFNMQPKRINNMFVYTSVNKLKKISKNYHKKLAKTIENSKLYGDAINKLAIKNCIAYLDFSYWEEDKDIRTVPKTINRYIVEMDSVIDKKNINFDEYPAIDYLPVRIKCE